MIEDEIVKQAFNEYLKKAATGAHGMPRSLSNDLWAAVNEMCRLGYLRSVVERKTTTLYQIRRIPGDFLWEDVTRERFEHVRGHPSYVTRICAALPEDKNAGTTKQKNTA